MSRKKNKWEPENNPECTGNSAQKKAAASPDKELQCVCVNFSFYYFPIGI